MINIKIKLKDKRKTNLNSKKLKKKLTDGAGDTMWSECCWHVISCKWRTSNNEMLPVTDYFNDSQDNSENFVDNSYKFPAIPSHLLLAAY